jgi:alpha-glucosidase
MQRSYKGTLKTICIIVCILLQLDLCAQKNTILKSPDGNIIYSFRLLNGKPAYQISYKKKILVKESLISLEFEKGRFGGNLKVGKLSFRDTVEAYELLIGKSRIVTDAYKEATISLIEQSFPYYEVDIVVRCFNDGVAFRYKFPQAVNTGSINLIDENTTFDLNGNPTVYTLFLPNYVSSHEGVYTTLRWDKVQEDTLMDMPTLFKFDEGIYLSITEAALLDYSGMYLSKHSGILRSKLSPLPGQDKIKVKMNLPHESPWRVVLVSDRIGTLMESNIITTLNKPCVFPDLSWLKAGKTTWTWWNGNISPDTTFAPGNNFEFHKYYIDFCAENGIEFHSVVEYGNREWYVNDGVGFVPGPNADVTRPVPGLEMEKICEYAKAKGVGIRVWVHWQALFPYPRLDAAFSALEKWGVKGLMVDFMDRDDQEMVNFQTAVLEKAAAHHLHVQFHGSSKPTGLVRTYPNEFTREGTLNYEANKWVAGVVTPNHDITIPFTRMIAGPTDYHLGGFRAVKPAQFKVQYTRPLMLGTRCHMIAMYVVLESYLGLISDFPEAYLGQQGFDFITKVPTIWDETKVLVAEINNFVVMGRRKNQDWYIGAINNDQQRQITIDLKFLSKGEYFAQIFRDASDVAEYPNKMIAEEKVVTANDSLNFTMAGGGGYAVHLRKKE